jgi:hypothetical protein
MIGFAVYLVSMDRENVDSTLLNALKSENTSDEDVLAENQA